MIVISEHLVLSPAEQLASYDHPVIGWRNILVAGGITADTADSDFPSSNLANPATHLEWRAADSTAQYLTFDVTTTSPIDYVGLAKHNLGSASIPVTIEATIDGETWDELIAERLLPDDTPAIFRFTPQIYVRLRIHFGAGTAPARIAVAYIGLSLMLERKIYVGHTPMPFARKTNIASARSETGNFLGRIVLGEWRETTIPLSLITPAWYRAQMDPFIAASKEIPFFFAWRPDTYPNEVGFGWLTDDPIPVATDTANLIEFSLSVNGIA